MDERAGWRARRTDGNSSAAVGLCWMVSVVFRLESNRNSTRRRRRWWWREYATADASTCPGVCVQSRWKTSSSNLFHSNLYPSRGRARWSVCLSLFFLPLKCLHYQYSTFVHDDCYCDTHIHITHTRNQWRCYHDTRRLDNRTDGSYRLTLNAISY